MFLKDGHWNIVYAFFQKSVCIWKKGAKTRIMTIYGEQTVITWSTLNFAAARESLMDEIALITVLPEE